MIGFRGGTETRWDAGGDFSLARTQTKFSVRWQNRDEHSPLSIKTNDFGRSLFMRVAGLALCFRGSNYLLDLATLLIDLATICNNVEVEV
jgi:hypothetical protein